MGRATVSPTRDAAKLAAQRPRSSTKHLAAIDAWLEELEAQHGPVPAETVTWADQVVDEWAECKRR